MQPEEQPINGKVVTALLDLVGAQQQDLAQWIGLNPSQVTRRLQGRTKWSAADIGRLARRLKVPVDTFYMTTDEAIERLRTPSSPDGGGSWAPPDSNRQPADTRSERALRIVPRRQLAAVA